MPVVIDEMTSHFEVRDEARLNRMIRELVKKAIAELRDQQDREDRMDEEREMRPAASAKETPPVRR